MKQSLYNPQNKDMPDLSPDIQAVLQKHRDAIDTIDRQIVALLKERIGIVGNVGQLKRNHTTLRSFIRSGREADMIRHFYAEFDGTAFAAEAAASIWRHIIAASTHHEAPLIMASVISEQDCPLRWLGREYFGSFIGDKQYNSYDELFAAMKSGDANIAIVPSIESRQNEWWPYLTHEDAPKIFACLPFIVEEGSQPAAYAIAYLTPEMTSDDTSFFIIEHEGMSEESFWHESLAQYGLNALTISTLTEDSLICKLEGYYTEHSNEIQELSLAMGSKITHIHWLGNYASPITRHT